MKKAKLRRRGLARTGSKPEAAKRPARGNAAPEADDAPPQKDGGLTIVDAFAAEPLPKR